MTESTPAATPAKISDLKPKMKLQGRIKKIELYGAFVDVGVGRDGLVHISALRRERVNKVEEVVQEGQEVTVWVRKVDAKAGRIDLTMVEPAGLEWDDLKRGQVHTGKVVRLEKFGAFVDIGAERPGLVHVKEMAGHRVDDPSELVKVGEEVDVKVLGVDPRRRQIELSMKAVEHEIPEDEPESPAATAMELALKRAMDATPSKEKKKTHAAGEGKGADDDRKEQENILLRTLRSQPGGPKQ